MACDHDLKLSTKKIKIKKEGVVFLLAYEAKEEPRSPSKVHRNSFPQLSNDMNGCFKAVMADPQSSPWVEKHD